MATNPRVLVFRNDCDKSKRCLKRSPITLLWEIYGFSLFYDLKNERKNKNKKHKRKTFQLDHVFFISFSRLHEELFQDYFASCFIADQKHLWRSFLYEARLYLSEKEGARVVISLRPSLTQRQNQLTTKTVSTLGWRLDAQFGGQIENSGTTVG